MVQLPSSFCQLSGLVSLNLSGNTLLGAAALESLPAILPDLRFLDISETGVTPGVSALPFWGPVRLLPCLFLCLRLGFIVLRASRASSLTPTRTCMSTLCPAVPCCAPLCPALARCALMCPDVARCALAVPRCATAVPSLWCAHVVMRYISP